MSRAFTLAALALLVVVLIVTGFILATRVTVVLALAAAVVWLVLYAWGRADRANREAERIRRKHMPPMDGDAA